MLTPFKSNRDIDFDGLKKLTDFYIDSGANGLFANCLSSEMFNLDHEERLAITRTVVKQCSGQIPVVATGTFSDDTSVNAEFIQRIYDTGIQAVVISTSQLIAQHDSNELLKSKLAQIMEATGEIPLGIYECPVPFKRLISPQLMKWLGESGRFLYHKDTSCDLDEIKEKLDQIEGTCLNLYNANTPTAYESLRYGAQGISPISANFYPELFSFLYNQRNEDDKISQLSDMLTIMENVTDRYYPWSAKWFLKERGLAIETICRVKIDKITYEDQVKLKSLMNIFINLAKSIEIPIIDIN